MLATLIKGKYCFCDVFAAILCLAPINFFTADMERLQKAFHALRKRYSLLGPLMAFSLSKNAVYPFSRQLEDALASCQLCRIIQFHGEEFKKYFLRAEGKSFIEKTIFYLFNDKELEQIKEMAKIFAFECEEA